MKKILVAMLCTIHIYNQQCDGIKFIDLPGFGSDEDRVGSEENGLGRGRSSAEVTGESGASQETQPRYKSIDWRRKASSAYPPLRPSQESSPNYRRHWLVSAAREATSPQPVDDKDENLKNKINMLVQQTMHDTDLKMKTVQSLKEEHRERPSYRVGFILSMIKKSRDVLNELFNVAVKHRDEWKALEQLKIFELIVHTNVDTTNLVRQLVEIHILNLNSTSTRSKIRNGNQNAKSRVVLL